MASSTISDPGDALPLSSFVREAILAVRDKRPVGDSPLGLATQFTETFDNSSRTC